MKGTRSQWVHVGAGFLSMAAFFVLMSYFQLFDTTIEYTNPSYVLKMTLSFLCLPLGLYFILSIYGKRAAMLMAGGMAAILVLAFGIGAMKWHIPLLAWLFGAYLLWALYGGLSSGQFEVNNRLVTKKDNRFHYWFTVALSVVILLFIALYSYQQMF
jgi:hypothetical protein